VLMAAQLSNAALRPLSKPAARAHRQLVCLHAGAPRVVAGESARPGGAMLRGPHLDRRWKLLVRTSRLSGVRTPRARRRLLL
jgi:hypothetical protein